MKISIMTRVFWECYRWPGRTFNYTLNQILKRIAGSSYECADLCEYPLEFWPLDLDEEDAISLKRMTNSLGLEVSGITVPTFSPRLRASPSKGGPSYNQGAPKEGDRACLLSGRQDCDVRHLPEGNIRVNT